VTLETEALLLSEQNKHGGELMRIELAHAAPWGACALGALATAGAVGCGAMKIAGIGFAKQPGSTRCAAR